MKINKLNLAIVIGFVSIIGILMAQLLWTREAFTLEEKKFSQKVHVALLEVVKKLYEGSHHELPALNPVEQLSNDYYIVNINHDFDPSVLEFNLKTAFAKRNIITDFEYAMYNCQSDKMVYGNYVSVATDSKKQSMIQFPKHKNLVYYFAIRFPEETPYLFQSLQFWISLSLALVVILLVYVYSIFTILQQKKYSELQRDFINNMTHEFKTPLSSILIASQFLKKQTPIYQDKKLDKYTQTIINQSHKLNSHIDKILNSAKWDNAPMVLEKESLDVLKTIDEIIENIRLKFEQSKIEVQTNTNPVFVNADAFHFSNLVYNLLENAIKYCESESEIFIKIIQKPTQLKLEFIDNGIGISEKNLPFIFDKFYRVTNQKSIKTNGFGLGLYYVKKVCLLHKWKILAQNNQKKGITISITVPTAA